MVDERIALYEERCTHASGGEWACRSCARHCCLDLAVASKLVGIWSGGGLQWLLITYAHTYETVTPLSIGRRLPSSDLYHGCY
jgi:hypothetical protein